MTFLEQNVQVLSPILGDSFVDLLTTVSTNKEDQKEIAATILKSLKTNTSDVYELAKTIRNYKANNEKLEADICNDTLTPDKDEYYKQRFIQSVQEI